MAERRAERDHRAPAEIRRRAGEVSTLLERATDRLADLVSPGRGLRRAHRRSMERDEDYREATFLALRLRGYKAASSSTNDTPWLNASNRSADSELVGDLATLRARSRALERDDALGSGIVATKRRHVIGSGLRPQARTGDAELDDALEDHRPVGGERGARALAPAVERLARLAERGGRGAEADALLAHVQTSGPLFSAAQTPVLSTRALMCPGTMARPVGSTPTPGGMSSGSAMARRQ